MSPQMARRQRIGGVIGILSSLPMLILWVCSSNLSPFERICEGLVLLGNAVTCYSLGKINGENPRNRNAENADKAIN